MQKQITKCAFKIQLDVGNTNVSFQNSPLNVNIYSGSYSWEPYYFGGKAFDESVGGRLRSQLSGYRFTAALLWDRSTSQDNLLAIASNATFGTERTLLSGDIAISASATTVNIAPIYNIPANDSLNGLKVQIGSDVRSITDSVASTDVITINASVTGGTTETVTVYSNVDQRTYLTFFPDASNTAVNHDVIISSIDWTAALEATIVSLPVRVDLEGQDVQNTIPTYYKI